VVSDPRLLANLVRHLVANAVRYTDAGGVLVGCRRAGGALRIEVWDTGIGIPEDQLAAVFEDFYQIGNRERDRAKGLGLGLSVVDRAARLLGHPLGVTSRLGKGTRFTVTVPLAATPRDARAAA
ncbi:MAG: ATP-binding protein, partial [Pseudomonadota bacterium]